MFVSSIKNTNHKFHLHLTPPPGPPAQFNDGLMKCIFCYFLLKYSYFILSCESEFEGSISQVKFFRPYDDDLVQPSELLTELAFDPAPINLLAVSTLSPSVVFEVLLFCNI